MFFVRLASIDWIDETSRQYRQVNMRRSEDGTTAYTRSPVRSWAAGPRCRCRQRACSPSLGPPLQTAGSLGSSPKDDGILEAGDELLVFGQPLSWIPGVSLASSLPQIVQEGSPKLQ